MSKMFWQFPKTFHTCYSFDRANCCFIWNGNSIKQNTIFKVIMFQPAFPDLFRLFFFQRFAIKYGTLPNLYLWVCSRQNNDNLIVETFIWNNKQTKKKRSKTKQTEIIWNSDSQLETVKLIWKYPVKFNILSSPGLLKQLLRYYSM